MPKQPTTGVVCGQLRRTKEDWQLQQQCVEKEQKTCRSLVGTKESEHDAKCIEVAVYLIRKGIS